VTLVGVTRAATRISVESTARFAHELGDNFLFVTDVYDRPEPRCTRNGVSRISPALGDTTTTAVVLASTCSQPS
jgi:hypothetical protein